MGTFEADAAQEYRRALALRVMIVAALAALLLIAVVGDVLIGAGTLRLDQVIGALLSPSTAEAGTRFIVWDLRMPMTLLALLTGVALGLSGLLMQTVLDNPLAEPFTLGVSSAAGFGAALVLGGAGFGLSGVLPPELLTAGSAFALAMVATGAVLLLSGGAANVQAVTLLGIALHFVFSALLSLVQYVASVDQLQSIVFWLMGSLQRATWLKVAIAAGVVGAVVPVVLMNAWALTALRSFGDEANVLGVPVRRLRMASLIAAALLAAVVTSFVGIIGFIGLVGPHVARMLVGEDHRLAIPATMAVGALFAVLASIATKMVVPGAILPLGMVTALTGLPFFIVLVLGQSRRGSL